MYYFFIFFMNFVSSCTRYVYDESMCTGYAPLEHTHLKCPMSNWNGLQIKFKFISRFEKVQVYMMIF
jgi:hypothetical protein